VIEVRPLTTAVGAEITGVDLRTVDDATVAEIRTAWLEHGVVFFRDQPMSPHQHVALAARFGEVVPPPVDSGVEQPVPGMLVLDQIAPVGAGTDRWHADSTFLPKPPMGAILRAVQLPPVGGDTLFASMHAAYEALSEPLRTMLDGLTAVHSSRTVDEIMGVERIPQWTVHPVVRTHPETGRRTLFVSGNWTTRIRELTRDESDHVLALLFDHIKSPMFQCRFHWTEGAVAFWDNRAVQHFASPDYDERRLMHRVLLAG
jgi:taurine dioxygenase